MPLNYYVWVVSNKSAASWSTPASTRPWQKSATGKIVRRSRGIKALGIDPEKVKDVIITHMTRHAGNIPLSPTPATIYRTRKWISPRPCMCPA